jgi:hypothetical protein
MAEDGAEVDDHAEGYQSYPRPERETVGVGGEMGFCRAELTEEEAEATDGEANAHETEAGTNPGEEGPLGREVNSGILLGGLVHGGIV